MPDSKTSLAYSLGYYDTDDYAGAAALVPDDTIDLSTFSRGIYVGGAGAIKATMVDGSIVTFSGLAAGTVLPVITKRLWVNASIATLGAITGGSLYTDGTYLNVALTGGTGTGATADIIVAGGAVTSVTLVRGGKDYTVADALSAAAASIGGTGSGFSIPVATINAGTTATLLIALY